MKKLPFLFMALLAAGGAFAKTTTWTSDGGGLFSEAANWDNGVPEEGDSVALVGYTAGVVFTNDLEGVKFHTLTTSHELDVTNVVTIVGNELLFTDTSVYVRVPAYCVTAFRTDVHAFGTFSTKAMVDKAIPHYYGKVTVDGTDLQVGPNDIYRPQFHAEVYAPNAMIQNLGNGSATFYGPVTAKSIHGGGYWSNGSFIFYGQGVDIAKWTIGSGGFEFHAATSCFTAPPVVDWYYSDYIKAHGGLPGGGGDYVFYENEIVDRISGEQPPCYTNGTDAGVYHDIMHVKTYQSWKDVTLTLKATANAVSYANLLARINLVYDPTGDFTQTFSNRAHTVNAPMEVRRGTLRFAGENATLKYLPKIIVSGGVFEIDTPAADAFSVMKTLIVTNSGVLRATSRVSGTLFASTGLTACDIEGGGRLELASGVTVRADNIRVDGVAPVTGTYTGVGYGSGSATECGWIVGGGQVVVDNSAYTSWKAPVSGDWSDATKWTHGVPTRDTKTYVTAHGANYTVTVNRDLMPSWLTVENGPAGDLTTMSVTEAWFTNAFVTVGRGGLVDVPPGGLLDYRGVDKDGKRIYSPTIDTTEGSADVIKIRNGGEIRVSGGTLNLEKWASYLGIGGYDGTPGRLSVTAGQFNFSRHNNLDRILVYTNGLFDVSGTGVFNPSGWGCVIGKTGAGATPGVIFRDSARLSASASPVFAGQGDVSYFISSEIFPTAPAAFSIAPYWNGGGYAYEVTETQKITMDFTNATISVGAAPTQVAGGNYAGNIYHGYLAKGILNLWNGATFTMDGSRDVYNDNYGGFSIGYGAFCWTNHPAKADGEVTVHGGASFVNEKGSSQFGICSRGTGSLTVDGGSFEHRSASKLFIVGLCGGQGSCSVKDGLLAVAGPAYVGGVVTNMLVPGTHLWNYNWTPDDHAAVGSFTQEGGDVSFGKSVILGSDGTATLEQVGKSGSFTAQSMVFSNSVCNADAGGTVKFTLDEKGVRPIALTDKLVIGRNAKLVVDASAYPVHGRTVTLFTCPGGIEGRFSEVTLTGAFAERKTVEYTDSSIVLRGLSGLTFFFW